MFKKYPLTMAMFLAGLCSTLMALSISHAGHPDDSDPRDSAIEDLQGATEASEYAAQCKGDRATDKVVCNGECNGEKDCKAECLKQYRACVSQCK
ncbi:MAG: hypothetical protein JZU50_09240 [Desulfobulbaceae bacterium]|nr:hypothetical protein [Desulfobulbaceae bacterium]